MKNITQQTPDQVTPRIIFVKKFVRNQDLKNKNILDIGCGYGWFEKHSLENNSNKIIGTEISELDLNTAKNYFTSKKVAFRVASAIDLPFKSNQFDTVVSWEVLEHIPKDTENKMFSEINRVLKKGGTAYLSTPYNTIASKFFDPAWWLSGHRHYSLEKIIGYTLDNGFVLKDVFVVGRWWNTILSLDMYVSKWILRRDIVFMDQISNKVIQENKNKNGFKNIYFKIEKI